MSVDLALVVTTNYSEDMQVHATETVRAAKFWLERLADFGERENGIANRRTKHTVKVKVGGYMVVERLSNTKVSFREHPE